MNYWIDIDDTISDTEIVLLNAAIDFHQRVLLRVMPTVPPPQNESPDYYGFARYLGWSIEDTKHFFHTNYPQLLGNLAVKPGVEEFFNQARACGHRIFLLSARRDREYGGRTMAVTKQWLGQNKLFVDDIILDCIDKAGYLRGKFGCFIDDSYENCMAVSANSKMQVIQFQSIYGKRCLDSKIMLMDRWGEADIPK